MEQLVKKKEIVSAFLRHNILVNRELLERLNRPEVVDGWHRAIAGGAHPGELLKETEQVSSVKVVWEYDDVPKKRSVQDFVDYFNARFRALQRLLQSRQELQNLTSIGRLRGKKDSEKVSVIGLVSDKGLTKKEHITLTLEDTTGKIKVLISKSNSDLYAQARDVVFDEALGVHGTLGDNIIFAKSIVIPDVPIGEVKKSPDEAYAAVISCVHVGSGGFERERFDRFVEWTNGGFGTQEERRVAQKLKYIFVCGDVVDGVGIYPGQERELSILDIHGQYAECARLFSRFPKHITLIISPGNHDVGRISEPQPRLLREYAQPLYDLPNAMLVCNPCVVNIHASDSFPGFNVLMYHGYSFDDYSEIVPSIKNSGTHISDRAALVMRFLLQRRHLAPQHSSTLYIPDPRGDPLVIERVPDLFFAGHIHKAGTLNYRSTTLVAGSCFQAKTDFQEKVGHDPEPGVVPLVNLQTRDVVMMRF